MRLLILLLWVAAGADACSCLAIPSVNEAWEQAGAVVVGDIAHTVDRAGALLSPQMVRVRVVESFKGPAKGADMTLEQPGTGCSPRFQQGARVLLYAHRAGDAWQVYGCGRGGDFAAEDLLFLRNLPRSAATTRLSGTLSVGERPAAGLAVQISSANGVRTAVTNADGVYEVYGLAPGQYQVAPKLPRGFKVMVGGREDRSGAGEREVILRERASATAGFVLQEDNRISGRVLDSAGNGLRQVCVELEMPDGQRFASASTLTDEDGGYSFEDLPRGQYRIVANREGVLTGAMPFPATFYPGVTGRAQASLVNVSPDATNTRFDIRIAKLESRTIFTGQVRFRDGAPIAGASVELFREGQRLAKLQSDAQGKFEIASLEVDGPGELRASVLAGPATLSECPHWQSYANAFTMTSQNLSVLLDTPQSGLSLTISVSSCPGHLPGR